MEKDRRRQAMLAEEIGEVVMQGDGCEVRVMNEAGFGRADVIVAVTGDDEDNLVICQMAKKKFTAPRTVARVNNPDNLKLFEKLGIDTTVSSTQIIFNLLEQQIEPGEIIPVGALQKRQHRSGRRQRLRALARAGPHHQGPGPRLRA